MNNRMPSPKLSYNCDGCLNRPNGSVGKINPQSPFVSFPYNSPLRKLPILTRPRPIGIARAAPSISLKKLRLFFLEKTKSAIKNLVLLEKNTLDTSSIKLIKTYYLISKLKLTWLVFPISKTILNILERQLLSKRPSLKIFDLYKLIYFLREKQNV